MNICVCQANNNKTTDSVSLFSLLQGKKSGIYTSSWQVKMGKLRQRGNWQHNKGDTQQASSWGRHQGSTSQCSAQNNVFRARQMH